MSIYHTTYAQKSDEEIQKRIEEKERELVTIFKETSFQTNNNKIKIAVMGCGDKRMVEKQKMLFKKLLRQNIEMYTYDITVEHLKNESNIFQHDCTQTLPHTPYDITYAHVLLKFVETDKQFLVLKNSFDVLNPGGIAIHILDFDEIKSDTIKLPDGYWSVPLKSHKEKLKKAKINYMEIKLNYGIALVLLK